MVACGAFSLSTAVAAAGSNQIQEEWMLWDQLSLVQQVGPAVPVG